MTTDAAPPDRRELSLALAAVLVAAEALALLVLGGSVLASISGVRVVLDVTTALFFLAYAAGLLISAVGLWRHRPWSRGPVVFAQLIQLGVAWSFFSGSTPPLAAVLLVVAVTVLALVLAPASTRALHGDVADS